MMTWVSLALSILAIVAKGLGMAQTAQSLAAGAAQERAKQLAKVTEMVQYANQVLSGPVRDKLEQLAKLHALRDEQAAGDN